MRLLDGTRVNNFSENMSAFRPHFNRVLNNRRPVDSNVLQHVPQCCTMWELNDPINWEEFCHAVRKLKMQKPQDSQVSHQRRPRQ
jgi:hypothetical protein